MIAVVTLNGGHGESVLTKTAVAGPCLGKGAVGRKSRYRKGVFTEETERKYSTQLAAKTGDLGDAIQCRRQAIQV